MRHSTYRKVLRDSKYTKRFRNRLYGSYTRLLTVLAICTTHVTATGSSVLLHERKAVR